MLFDTDQLRHGSVSLPFILARPARLNWRSAVLPQASESCTPSGGAQTGAQAADYPKQAAEQLKCTERQVRRLLKRLKSDGDKAVIHGLRGRVSNRKRSEQDRDKIVRILSQQVYHDFGPTLAAEYLAKKHKIKIGREALRKPRRPRMAGCEQPV